MNILFIEQSLDPSLGGIEKVTRKISDKFIQEGHRCYFVYNKTDDDNIESLRKLKVSYNVSYKEFSLLLENFIKDKNINIVIFQDTSHKYLYNFFKEYKKGKSIKLIYCFHVSPDYWIYFKHRFNLNGLKYYLMTAIGQNPYIRSIKRMNKIVDNFVLLSQSFVNDFCSIYKIQKEKVKVIPNPLSFPEDTYSSQKENIILIVSRFCERQKNIKSALRIWGKIEIQNPTWKLLIVGYGEDENAIKTYAQDLNLKSISFEGKQDNVIRYYSKSKIFMMTSNFEGFGMTLIEAQQLGCVPIAFDNFSVLHDIVTNGKNGLIVPSRDEKQYASYCQEIMNNNDLFTSLSLNAIESCKKFNINNIYMKWQLFLQ